MSQSLEEEVRQLRERVRQLESALLWHMPIGPHPSIEREKEIAEEGERLAAVKAVRGKP